MTGVAVAKETVGQRLAELRRRKARDLGRRRITQGEVAEAVGVARQTVVYWENDKQVPEGENLRKLAQFYDTTPDYILGGDAHVGVTTIQKAPSAYVPSLEPDEVIPPNYEGLGIEVPERDRLHPRPRDLFDRFMHQLIDMGLGREDLEYWGRTVLAPIAHMNTLHRGRGESEAATEEEQTWIVERNVEAALRIIHSRRG